MRRRFITASGAIAAFCLFVVAGCGGSEAGSTGGDASAAATSTPGGTPATGAALTDVEMEQGIGPVRDLELAPLDEELATAGEEAFTLYCSACHKFEERYIGPELGQVLERRRPEFVMNMVLNANEMVARHPVVREMLAEYFTPMAQQNVSEEEARAILEYIRKNQASG